MVNGLSFLGFTAAFQGISVREVKSKKAARPESPRIAPGMVWTRPRFWNAVTPVARPEFRLLVPRTVLSPRR